MVFSLLIETPISQSYVKVTSEVGLSLKNDIWVSNPCLEFMDPLSLSNGGWKPCYQGDGYCNAFLVKIVAT